MLKKNMSSNMINISSKHFDEVQIGLGEDLVLIAGPCAIETRDHSMRMAEMIGSICRKLGIRWIFKACYDKDCRSSPNSFHGVGLDEGLRILADVREAHAVPVTSDFLTLHGEMPPASLRYGSGAGLPLSADIDVACRCSDGQAGPFKKGAVYEPVEYEKFLP